MKPLTIDGTRVRTLRLQAGQSFSQILVLSGISRTTLYRIESQTRAKVRESTLLRLANACGVSVMRLLTGKE